ncbi:hypothetical protein ACJMK2_010824 [Sinanodonta woodiana]|uniref:EamA domain-containing protein n=1 Tax=Sinanodonta woodiana TaxID=1069815 RepID=A0ABD3VGN7_SINWO
MAGSHGRGIALMAGSHGRGIALALIAGSMAALGSTSAKLAMTGHILEGICTNVLSHLMVAEEDQSMSNSICHSVSFGLRVACFLGIFIFNALMWTFYTKSLQFCRSTVEATVTNTAANFLLTAVIGFMLFGEHLSVKWWLGSCLILTGLWLIHKGSQKDQIISGNKKRS